MIEVLATDKISEGMLYKNSQIRYTWWIKMNTIPHIIELVIGSLGKKQVILDQKEMYNSRSVLSSNFHYKLVIDDSIFIIKNDNDDFDVYTDEYCTVSFKQLLENSKNDKKTINQQPVRSILPDINQFSTLNEGNRTDHNRPKQSTKDFDLIGMENGIINNQSKGQNKFSNFNFDAPAKKSTEGKGRLFDELNTDFFENKPQGKKDDPCFDDFVKNPFDTDKNNKITEDLSFKNPNSENNNYGHKSNYRIFDNVPVDNLTKNLQVSENLFEEVNDAFKNAKLIENEGEYIVTHQNNLERTNFDMMDDFDKQLEQNKTLNKPYLKSPFDIDPEEGLHSLGKGLKRVFKKAQKTLHHAE